MNVYLDQLQQNQVSVKTSHQYKKENIAKISSYQNAAMDTQQNCKDDIVYQKESLTKKEMKSVVNSYDAKNAKDAMVVVANTSSDYDLEKLNEDGINLRDLTPDEMVTVVDEIKVTLAKAGIEISGYNDDLDLETVQNVTNNAAYASSIVSAFHEKDLPFTEYNIKECQKQMDFAENIRPLTDDAKKYLIENEIPFSMEELYKASFIGTNSNSKQLSEEISGKVQQQIDTILDEGGLAKEQEGYQKALWMMENNIPVTVDNFQKLNTLNKITNPLDLNQVALAAADILSVGLSPEKVESTEYLQKAVSIMNQTKELKEETIDLLLLQGKPITLQNLFHVHNDDTQINVAEKENSKSFKYTLLQLQHKMSAEANLRLMRQGIKIELEPVEQLLKQYEQLEQQTHIQEYKETKEKVSDLKNMPASILSLSMKENWQAKGILTLDNFHKTGTALIQNRTNQLESYDTLMTQVRKDLGDSIKTAFQSTDNILEQMEQPLNDENRRAVRILGYNQMEITKASLEEVKSLDTSMQRTLSLMTPQNVLKLLRSDQNPLEMDINQLYEVLKTQNQSEEQTVQNYSQFLQGLEQNKEITEQEREGYIGIYRMLHQIENSDGAALGSVYQQHKNLSLKELLSSVRTKKIGSMDITIDKSFGLMEELSQKGSSITDQINNYYKQRAGILKDQMQQNLESKQYEHTFDENRLNQFDEAMLENAVSNQGKNLTYQEILDQTNFLSSQGDVWKQLLKDTTEDKKSKSIKDSMEKIREALVEGKDEMLTAYQELCDVSKHDIENEIQKSTDYVDIRSKVIQNKQLSIAAGRAKEEDYFVPIENNGEILQVRLKMVHDESNLGYVTIETKSEALGNLISYFYVSKQTMQGIISTNQEDSLSSIQKISRKCEDAFVKELGYEADIKSIYTETMDLTKLQSEGTERTKVNSNLLYKVAKIFIQAME